MKKSELKSGMRCIDRNGESWYVLLNSEIGDILVLKDYFTDFNYLRTFTDEMLSDDSLVGHDIMKVYSREGELLWERDMMTVTMGDKVYTERDIMFLINKVLKDKKIL